jgi:DMSO reductase anchor subunit
MNALRRLAAALLSKGVISSGWDSVLTGVAMLAVVLLLAQGNDGDSVTIIVAIVLAVTGVWCIERGLRSEYQRRPRPDESPASE